MAAYMRRNVNFTHCRRYIYSILQTRQFICSSGCENGYSFLRNVCMSNHITRHTSEIAHVKQKANYSHSETSKNEGLISGSVNEKKRLRLAKKEARRQIVLNDKLSKKKIQTKSIVYSISTPVGQKKDVSVALPELYRPEYVEAAWYDWWHQEGFFKPETGVRESMDQGNRFVICLPPPNVTGTLHLGHALGNSIQDTLARWHRMNGHAVLWVPGMDHAGIATQVVVEKQLDREMGLDRHQLGREAFIDQVWKWKQRKGGVISEQMQRLGSSLDWSREFFTLSPVYSQAVSEAFIRLHERGLIYRKERLVNWSCALRSTISDIEVNNIPLEKKTYLSVPGYEKKIPFGELTSFAYPVEGSDEEVVVATTRLETMLGDTGVAVHPADHRFTHLHGRMLVHPITGDRLPLLTDETVQKDFGSGAVKITPAHDKKDYDLGLRHGLPLRNVLDDNGCLVNVPERFKGMPRFEARKVVLDMLKNKSLFRGSSNHAMTLPQCSRSGDVIEPRMKDQWYVDCGNMSEKALKAVDSGALELIPKMYEAHWNEWLKDARDWCISRQLWWGHRVPAYRVALASGKPLAAGAPKWVSAHNETEARKKAVAILGVSPDDILLKQDEDVLDTWFSSAIVPFAVMGWPNKAEDLEQYYPISLMETASDILFFWVARMVMLGQELTGTLPFKKVLLHSILRDSHGRKMSKSLGNIVDPMDVINGTTLEALHAQLESSNLPVDEVTKARAGQTRDFPCGIGQCGTDALRFTLLSYNYKNQYVNVDVSHMEAHQRFCNKVWQAFRYCSAHWGPDYSPPQQLHLNEYASATDLWILSQLSETVDRCNEGFNTYSLNHATSALHSFWWQRFCDVYLEYSKIVLAGGHPERICVVKDILHVCVSTGLRALSPVMPFITEELYQRLPGIDLDKAPSVMLASYPKPSEYPWRNAEVDDAMKEVKKAINQILSLRTQFSINKTIQEVSIVPPSETVTRALMDFNETLTKLSKTETINILETDPGQLVGCIRQVATDGPIIYMKLHGLVDRDGELSKISSKKTKLETQRLSLINKGSNKNDERLELIKAEKINKLSTEITRLEQSMETLKTLS